MKLIFLDFDGVLHPNFCQEEHYFSRIGYLMAALDGFKDDVEVIISSSWRFHWPADWRALDDADNEFPKGCRELIRCEGRTGLDDSTVARLRLWLKGA